MEEFVHEEDVVAPFFVKTGVAVAEVEHVESAVVETGEIAGPDEFLFAFFVEVDAIGYVAEGLVWGEGLLHGEVGYLALCKVVEYPFGMSKASYP